MRGAAVSRDQTILNLSLDRALADALADAAARAGATPIAASRTSIDPHVCESRRQDAWRQSLLVAAAADAEATMTAIDDAQAWLFATAG